MVETCRNGHPRTTENTRVRPNGWLRCRDCDKAGNKKRRAKRYAAPSNGRYEASLKGYWRKRKFQLKKKRARIVAELDRLAKEENDS